MCRLEVKISENEKSYPIFITNQDIENLQTSILSEINNKNYIVIINKKVFKLYGKLLNFPKENIFILPDGEKEKNFKNYTKILNFAFKKNLKRDDAIIAIGGGVTGDLAGFCASTYMRGINFIQVPTTLLADTDSSVGGKTAINTKYGKNLVGAFYQPKAVFVNVNFLKTLDPRQFKSGLGEVLKYGFIEKSTDENLGLINFLNDNYKKILSQDVLTLKELIEICIKMKIAVVTKDEKEKGLRKILNFGHTYGHALEKLSNYKYTHGESVIAGIYKALDIAFKLGKIDKEYKFLVQDLIKKFNFVNLPDFDKNKIIDAMTHDKKSEQDGINYVLPTGFGEVQVFKFSKEELKNLI